MKKFFVAAIFLSAAVSQAYVGKRVDYYCTVGNPFADGISQAYSAQVVSDTESPLFAVSGIFAGKSFEFSSRISYNKSTNIATWSSSQAKAKFQIEVPGYGDGGQDTLWGKITIGSRSRVLNCYTSL